MNCRLAITGGGAVLLPDAALDSGAGCGLFCSEPKLMAWRMCCAASHASPASSGALSFSFEPAATVLDAVLDARVALKAGALVLAVLAPAAGGTYAANPG